MNTLLSLFESVQVESTDVVSKEDIEFCEKTHNEHDAVLESLSAWEAGLENLAKTLPQVDGYEITGRSKTYVYNGKSLSQSSLMDQFGFTHLYGIAYIQNTRRELKEKYKKDIVSYFNKRYNLSIDANSLPDKDTLHWRQIVDRIVTITGGSLVSSGIEKMHADFTNQFLFREDRRPVLKNDVITIAYMNFSYNCYGPVDDISSQEAALIRALHYFEFSAPKASLALRKHFATEKVGEFVAAPEGYKKYAGFRYFKKRRLDLKFKNSAFASEFYKLFIKGREHNP